MQWDAAISIRDGTVNITAMISCYAHKTNMSASEIWFSTQLRPYTIGDTRVTRLVRNHQWALTPKEGHTHTKLQVAAEWQICEKQHHSAYPVKQWLKKESQHCCDKIRRDTGIVPPYNRTQFQFWFQCDSVSLKHRNSSYKPRPTSANHSSLFQNRTDPSLVRHEVEPSTLIF